MTFDLFNLLWLLLLLLFEYLLSSFFHLSFLTLLLFKYLVLDVPRLGLGLLELLQSLFSLNLIPPDLLLIRIDPLQFSLQFIHNFEYLSFDFTLSQQLPDLASKVTRFLAND